MAAKSIYHRHRFPPEIISHCVWLYFRFTLSFRDVEELMLARGISVSYEAIRTWCTKFGNLYAKRIRHRQGRPGDTWFMDEVYLKINGERVYLWRAVDQEGTVVDILVQKKRNRVAAKRFFRKLLKGAGTVPRRMVTDFLGSYSAARQELMSSVDHIRGGRSNNRAENSHEPTRDRERHMRRFKSHGHAQRFLSTFSAVSNHFRFGRHLVSAPQFRLLFGNRMNEWNSLTETAI